MVQKLIDWIKELYDEIVYCVLSFLMPEDNEIELDSEEEYYYEINEKVENK